MNVISRIKLMMDAGKAMPGPKIASVLGPRGIAIPKFCEAFNKITSVSDKYRIGDPIIVTVIVYDNKSYDFFVNNLSPVAYLLKQAAGLTKGASNSGKDVICKISKSVITDIAERKMADMKVDKLESAEKMVLGTARSMGIEVEDLE